MAKEIELQNGMKAIVDDEDFGRVNQYNWTATAKGTTFNVFRNKNGVYQNLSDYIMEHEISNGKVIRKNKDSLDYRKENLLLVKNGNVHQSKKGVRETSSQYKGVSWDKGRNLWKSQIRVEGKLIFLGRFKSEDDAAKQYNLAAREHFGEHSYQNVIGKNNLAKGVSIDKIGIPRTRKQNKTSKYRGVYSDQVGWIAQIKNEYIGWFRTEIEAAKAYNEKAKEMFGDKAILNDIPARDDPSLWRAGNGLIKSGGAMLKKKQNTN